jgi:uncharacterized protein (TIGR02246 family)
MKQAVTAMILAGVLLAGSSPVFAGDDRQAVIDAMQAWEKAVESKDYDALEQYYAEDAVYYPADALPVVGRAAIVERNRRRGAAADVEITQKPDDVQVRGDWAIYSCLARVSLPASAGRAASERHVRVLLVMQRDAAGRWQILRDIDNASPEPF